METNEGKSAVSRRDFIKTAGVLGGIALAGQAVPSAAAPMDDKPVAAEKAIPSFAVIPSNPIAGAIDMHLHGGSDNVRRSVNVLEVAQKAREAGMRGVLLYNHQIATHPLAYLVRQVVQGVEVFGGITLNYPVGGINLAAVDMAISFTDGLLRFVKLPTQSAGNDLSNKAKKPNAYGEGPGLWIKMKDGKLNPDVAPILKTVAKNDLLLLTGHISPEESLLALQAAKDAGVKKMMVTHAMSASTKLTLDQMKKATALGAYIELCYLNVFTGAVKIDEVVQAIKEVGADHIVLSTDLGQALNPVPSEGLRDYVTQVTGKGVTKAEVDAMIRKNPATLLGLDGAPAV